MVSGLSKRPDISDVIFDAWSVLLYCGYCMNVVTVHFARRTLDLINSLAISHAKRRVMFVCFICGVVRGKSRSKAG